MTSTPNVPARWKVALLGAALFALALPCLWGTLTTIFLEFTRNTRAHERVGIIGFLLTGLGLPIGAVLGALVGGIGDPAKARRRWLITAAVCAVASVGFWRAVLLPD